MKKYLSTLLPLLIVLYLFPSTLQAQNRPNILIIIADDMGTDAFGAYNIGTDLPHTPQLDSLLSKGILFHNAYTYPTCAPSRASMLTGRYGNKNGVMRSGPNLPNSEITLFEQIESITNGAYANAAFGKWHLGNANHPNTNGVQTYIGNLSSGVADYFNWERTTNGLTDTSTTYATTYVTNEAINWIDQQSKPWFLWMAYNAPHSPFHLPPDSLYTRTQTSSDFDKYMCMIESVDHEVGRLYNSLTQQEKDSTIIIFAGDNGTPNSNLQGYPRRQGKGTIYEGGIRVPMFVSGYGVSRINERENALVNFTDVFATLTEMLGVKLEGGIDNSFSFNPLLSDPNATGRPYVYSELEDGAVNRAIRNDQYKLILRASGDQEFYDLLADSLEETDLLLGQLSTSQQLVLDELQAEADSIFTSWSCHDLILNGSEEGIDCGGNSCQSCSAVSVELLPEAPFKLYPNPASCCLRIESVGEWMEDLRIYDLAGNVVEEKNISSLEMEVDIRGYLPGLYVLEIQGASRSYRYKFLKE